MKTEEIKALLIEASTTTDGSRKIAIHAALGDAADEITHVVLDTLYVSVMRNSPEMLPGLLPAFVVMCGERDENTTVGYWEPSAEPPATVAEPDRFLIGNRVIVNNPKDRWHGKTVTIIDFMPVNRAFVALSDGDTWAYPLTELVAADGEAGAGS